MVIGKHKKATYTFLHRWLNIIRCVSLFLRRGIRKVKRNGFCRFFFLGINHLGVDLRGLDIGMAEHLAHRINISATSQLQRGVRMTEAMEGDVFVDSG